MYSSEILLFASGGCSNYRIPSIVSTNDGTILAFCNDRKNSLADHAKEVSLVYARKKNGQSWEPEQTMSGIPGWACGIGSAIYDSEENILFCSADRNPVARDEFGTFTDEEIAAMEAQRDQAARELGIIRGPILFRSTDNGDTWNDLPMPLQFRPFTTTDGRTIQIESSCHGSAHGIQLKHGTHKGRLLWPSRFTTGRYTNWAEATLACYNNSIYSDDHGNTWQTSAPVQQGTGEGTLIELSNGDILYNSRSMWQDQIRLLATSTDGGETYHNFRPAEFIYEEKHIGCNASFLRVEKEELPALPGNADSITLFANPRAEDRSNMTVCVSFDEGQTWSHTKQVWAGGSAYSSLVYDPVSRHFFLLYEKGETSGNPYEYGIALLEFDLEWLMS